MAQYQLRRTREQLLTLGVSLTVNVFSLPLGGVPLRTRRSKSRAITFRYLPFPYCKCVWKTSRKILHGPCKRATYMHLYTTHTRPQNIEHHPLSVVSFHASPTNFSCGKSRDSTLTPPQITHTTPIKVKRLCFNPKQDFNPPPAKKLSFKLPPHRGRAHLAPVTCMP